MYLLFGSAEGEKIRVITVLNDDKDAVRVYREMLIVRDWGDTAGEAVVIVGEAVVTVGEADGEAAGSAADGWSLNIASSGQGQSPSLVDIYPQGRSTTTQKLAQALRLWSNNIGKLWATSWWRCQRVPRDVVQARRHTNYCVHTARRWLSCHSCPEHGHHRQNHRSRLNPLMCHWKFLDRCRKMLVEWDFLVSNVQVFSVTSVVEGEIQECGLYRKFVKKSQIANMGHQLL